MQAEELETKHGRIEEFLKIQRDLGIALSSTSDLTTALNLIIEATCRIKEIDCGGIYFVDEFTGSIDLISYKGLPTQFVEVSSHYKIDSPQGRIVMAGKSIYGHYSEISPARDEIREREGLRALAIIPAKQEKQVVAVLNLASHTHDEVPFDIRHALEAIASQIGGVIGRLKVETLLKESQKDLKTLFDTIDDFIFILDPEGNILHVNATVEKRLGYPADKLSSMNVVEVHPLEQREEAASIIDKMMAGKLAICPISLMTKDGVLVPVETKVTRGRWAGQDVLIGVSRDVTERRQVEQKLEKAYCELERRVEIRTAELARANADLQTEITVRMQAEEKLRKSEERFLEMAENIREVFWLFDWIEQKVVYVSPAYEIIWGRAVEDLYARYDEWAESIHADDLAYAQTSFTEIAETGESKIREYRIVRPDGEIRWISDRGFSITDESDRICRIAGIAEDITERKREEDERRELEIKVQQAQRLESLGTLAGGIAHDFNNLLMAIQGNASFLLFNIESSHPHFDSLKNIEKCVRSGAQLTSQLLGYARKGKYRVKPLNLNDLVKETADVISRTRKEILFHLELSEDLFAIEAERSQIEQVLLNLYVNAADSMPGGGNIILKSLNVTHEDMRGKLYDPKPGNYVRLTVTDTGIGMSESTKERIFEPFFTTKEMGRGTGLGLASVYGIVKSHGGFIEVESEKGQGTVFTVFLPASSKKIHKTIMSDDRIVEGSETIMLVDDEEIVLGAGAKMLERLGYIVLRARSGKEAVEVYKAKNEAINLVILDMIMPELGGGETFDEMKEINQDVKVLLSSGYSIEGNATEILNRGCAGFIQKPFSMHTLSEKVREILD